MTPETRGPRRGKPLPKNVVSRSKAVHCEIVSVGRDLLQGQAVDRNGPFLAETLHGHGALVHRITVVDDREKSIASAIDEALTRGTHLLVVSGGLGPAPEDRTLAALAEALQRPLSEHAGARRMVEQRYSEMIDRGLAIRDGMNAGRAKMCALPVGAEPIENEAGPSPGVMLKLTGGAVVLALPGNPDEARAVCLKALPHFDDMLPKPRVASREIETPTGDESALKPIVEQLSREFPGVEVTCKNTGVSDTADRTSVLLAARAHSQREAELQVEAALRRLLDLSVRLIQKPSRG